MFSKEKENAIEFLKESTSFLEDESIIECLKYAVDKRRNVTYEDMVTLGYFMDTENYEDCIDYLAKNKMIGIVF